VGFHGTERHFLLYRIVHLYQLLSLICKQNVTVMTRISRYLLWLIAVTVLSACGESDKPFHKATFPVTGQIYVDGRPATSPIAVRCVNVGEVDKEHPTSSATYSDTDGKFEIATYEKGDGVPVGEYVLTFQWGEMNIMSRTYSGDKFKGRYRDPKKSKVRFKVEEGKPTDLGRIDLTTGNTKKKSG